MSTTEAEIRKVLAAVCQHAGGDASGITINAVEDIGTSKPWRMMLACNVPPSVLSSARRFGLGATREEAAQDLLAAILAGLRDEEERASEAMDRAVQRMSTALAVRDATAALTRKRGFDFVRDAMLATLGQPDVIVAGQVTWGTVTRDRVNRGVLLLDHGSGSAHVYLYSDEASAPRCLIVNEMAEPVSVADVIYRSGDSRDAPIRSVLAAARVVLEQARKEKR